MARGVPLVLALGVAAVVGVIVGARTATPSAPRPTTAVAALPTSTPDLRPTLPPQTLTPTQRPTVAPSPVPTPPPASDGEPRGRAVVWFARPGLAPIEIDAPDAIKEGTISTRIWYRIVALRQIKTGWPAGTLNLVGTMKARLLEVDAGEGLTVIGFLVPDDGDWGISHAQLPLLLQQIVFTATEEPGIERVQLRQNGGETAVIAGVKVTAEMTRESVR